MEELTLSGSVVSKAEEWNQRLLECKSSGMTVPDWCRMQKINIKTYYYWHHKIHEMVKMQEPETSCKGFYEIGQSIKADTESTECIRIRVGKCIIEVPKAADEATLSVVLRAIQTC